MVKKVERWESMDNSEIPLEKLILHYEAFNRTEGKSEKTVSWYVGNQQKWDTLVKERSGRNGSVVGLPEQVVVALSSG